MKNPNVSVIVPNYNHSLYLNQRLDSILNQTYQDFEVIILDDCSSDDSKDIIETYRENKKVSHIIYNERNSGSPFKQWLKGVQLAIGKYIWIAESDDYSSNIFLEIIIKRIQQYNVGICYCDSNEITENNEMLGRWSRWQKRLEPNIWKSNFTEDGKMLNLKYNFLYNIIPNASSTVFLKHLFDTSEYLNHIENFKYNGDWLMWFSILEKTTLHYYHKPLNFFRYHLNTTRNDTKNVNKIAYEDYYSILIFRKKTNSFSTNNKLVQTRMIEIFNKWNPSLKDLLSLENYKTIRIAIKSDPNFLEKIITKLKTRFVTL